MANIKITQLPSNTPDSNSYLAFDNGTVTSKVSTGYFAKESDVETLNFLTKPLINQWDECWEKGTYDDTTGQKSAPAPSQIRCVHKIPVKPSTEYYIYFENPRLSRLHFYASDGSYISNYINEGSEPFTYTTPSNAYYMTFQCSGTYGGTYLNDISINPSSYTDYYQSILHNVGIDSLWLNASPSANFSPQTLTLDLSNYSFVIIVYKMSTSSDRKTSVIVGTNDSPLCFGYDSQKIMYRTYDRGVGLAFNNGNVMTSYGTVSADNSKMIPYQIFGIK